MKAPDPPPGTDPRHGMGRLTKERARELAQRPTMTEHDPEAAAFDAHVAEELVMERPPDFDNLEEVRRDAHAAVAEARIRREQGEKDAAIVRRHGCNCVPYNADGQESHPTRRVVDGMSHRGSCPVVLADEILEGRS